MAHATAFKSSSPECHKTYLYEAHIHLLGIRFLKNSPQGFETEVQSAMNFLLHEAVMSSNQQSKATASTEENDSTVATTPLPSTNTSTHLDLPTVTLRIPSTLSGDVEIILEKRDLSKFEHMSKANQLNHDDLFVDGGNNSLQQYLSKLVSQPITIPVNQLFLYRGLLNTSVERCLALTTNFSPLTNTVSETAKNVANRYQQCLVLYAESPAKVTDILDVFRKLHGIAKNPPKSASPDNMRVPTEYKVVMVAGVEIQEEVSEGKWHSCPIDKEGFKLRTTLDKKIIINLHQDMTHFNYPNIRVEKCFGMLLSPGKPNGLALE